MPLTPQPQSDLLALISSLPTVREAVLAKQGLRQIRDEMLYRHPKDPLQPHQTERLQGLGLSSLLMDWISSPEGQTIFTDIQSCGADAILQAFDAQIKQAELIQLNLAYQASTDDTVRFHKWFNQVLGRPVMLDIRFSPQLLAGITFTYQSQLHDYSLKRQLPQIEQELLQNYHKMALTSTVDSLPTAPSSQNTTTPTNPSPAESASSTASYHS